MKNLLEAIVATVEIMGGEISPVSASMMAKDLSGYRHDDVIAALQIVRSGSQRFSLKAIVDALGNVCHDGRPGADEAWAMIPRDEYASVVWTQEIAEAMGVARPLLEEGDQVAARMAFKEAYTRIVEQNKTAGIAPKWYPSLGYDKAGRAPVLAEAIRLGRIDADQSVALIAPDAVTPMLQMANIPNYGIESHKRIGSNEQPVSKEKALENIARLKAILGASRIGSV